MASELTRVPAAIGIYKPDDVRPIIQKYRGTDVPTEYAKAEAEAKRVFLADYAKSHGGKAVVSRGLGSGAWTMSALFGAVRLVSIQPAYTDLTLRFCRRRQIRRRAQRR